jgi:hypothetical protein
MSGRLATNLSSSGCTVLLLVVPLCIGVVVCPVHTAQFMPPALYWLLCHLAPDAHLLRQVAGFETFWTKRTWTIRNSGGALTSAGKPYTPACTIQSDRSLAAHKGRLRKHCPLACHDTYPWERCLALMRRKVNPVTQRRILPYLTAGIIKLDTQLTRSV